MNVISAKLREAADNKALSIGEAWNLLSEGAQEIDNCVAQCKRLYDVSVEFENQRNKSDKLVADERINSHIINQKYNELLIAVNNMVAAWDNWTRFAGVSDEDCDIEAALVRLSKIAKEG